MGSLQEQLLKAGFVSKDKARKVRTEKRKHKKQVSKKPANAVQVVSDSSKLTEYSQAKKKARDQKLNRQRQKAQERKETAEQIRQMIESAKIDRGNGEIPYQFMDGKKIKKIYVTSELQQRLIKGSLAIVKSGGSYELVNLETAEKIKQRDNLRVLTGSKPDQAQEDANDPYAEYKIPDDLVW